MLALDAATALTHPMDLGLCRNAMF